MGKFRNLINIYRYNGIKGVYQKVKYKFSDGYKNYLKNEIIPSKRDMDEEISTFIYKPLISVITPIYKPKLSELKDYFDSLLEKNAYQNIELCLVIDGAASDEVINYILNYQKNHPKTIKCKINEENLGIAIASNEAIAISTGDYIALVDQDDMVAPHAFFEYVKVLQKKKYDFLYSDEDLIDEKNNRSSPDFKPDWSPHTLLSRMYVNHLSMYKRSIINKIGGFDPSYSGAQDYDLLLRASKNFKSTYHVSKILYHWRMSEQSIAKDVGNKVYVIEQAKQTITNFFENIGRKASVVQHEDLLIYDVVIEPIENSLISIIIPFKNNFDLTKDAVESVIAKNPNMNLEFLLVDNESTLEEKEKYQKFVLEINDLNAVQVKMIEANYNFNYSKINNTAANQANGEYLLFLNNDIEFFEANSLKKLLGVAQLDFSGAVGCTLYYPDDTIQHAGVLLGYHEVAGHSGVGQYKDVPGYYGKNVSLVNFSAVTAACMMIKKEKFFQVFGFEEELAVAYNDVDLCLKLLKEGYYNVNVGNVHVRHHESKTRGFDKVHDLRYQQECSFMWAKWEKLLKRDPYYNKNLSINVGELYQIKQK